MNVFSDALAALVFFTKLPLWKWRIIPAESFRRIIPFWALTALLTAAVLAGTWWLFSTIFPTVVALVLAFAARTLFTGALHEDGLSDFFDGFGGGRTKADTLRIMKDSSVGSFALIGMIAYYFLLIGVLSALPKELIFNVLLIADPAAKFFVSLSLNFLSYARTEAESKAKVIFEKSSVLKLIMATFFGLVPLFVLFNWQLIALILVPAFVVFVLSKMIRSRIGGYTGDTCGAIALLTELSFFFAFLAYNQLINKII
ncbi:MAG: adenosylcobinamide-GDP ribazoletransferase [Porphyromonadaceae bacterium CG2_30_38_12]|nr:MAG: adenosylcobinamide-GDP ribazoletransferase [Porphyromonadaceae bacterium CG2_30_38_12]